MEKGERIELRFEEDAAPIPVRFVVEDTDGWVGVTTELEYESACLRGVDPEPLLKVPPSQIVSAQH
ncbi:MAG TPA: hypothetical protein VGZ02_06535 [Candidatus Baltobacteraceae bacterium]|jgi:hypothetical protein|nr:hypothetical protein [Candidatus Baltobacteraceae bacterium]